MYNDGSVQQWKTKLCMAVMFEETLDLVVRQCVMRLAEDEIVENRKEPDQSARSGRKNKISPCQEPDPQVKKRAARRLQKKIDWFYDLSRKGKMTKSVSALCCSRERNRL